MQVAVAESRAKELQEELTGVYKEKSRLAEELVAASRQLQIVRDSNEAQARELDDLAAKGRDMRARIKELSDALEKEQAATSLATAELQVQPSGRSCLLEPPSDAGVCIKMMCIGRLVCCE